MFKVVKNRTFTIPVKVMTPVDGGHLVEELKVTYNYLPTDQTAQFDMKTAAGTDAFLAVAVRRLDDLTDEADNPLPYSDELRDQILKQPHVRNAVVAEYAKAVTTAAEGN